MNDTWRGKLELAAVVLLIGKQAQVEFGAEILWTSFSSLSLLFCDTTYPIRALVEERLIILYLPSLEAVF